MSARDRTIEVRRIIAGTGEEVFEAWIDPELLARWMAPGDLTATVDCWEPRPGGGFRVVMRDEARDETHVVGGQFLEIEPPARLRMTWLFQGEPEPASIVEVEFLPADGGTEVVIQHDSLGDEDAPIHTAGWNGCLDKLERMVPS